MQRNHKIQKLIAAFLHGLWKTNLGSLVAYRRSLCYAIKTDTVHSNIDCTMIRIFGMDLLLWSHFHSTHCFHPSLPSIFRRSKPVYNVCACTVPCASLTISSATIWAHVCVCVACMNVWVIAQHVCLWRSFRRLNICCNVTRICLFHTWCRGSTCETVHISFYTFSCLCIIKRRNIFAVTNTRNTLSLANTMTFSLR